MSAGVADQRAGHADACGRCAICACVYVARSGGGLNTLPQWDEMREMMWGLSDMLSIPSRVVTALQEDWESARKAEHERGRQRSGTADSKPARKTDVQHGRLRSRVDDSGLARQTEQQRGVPCEWFMEAGRATDNSATETLMQIIPSERESQGSNTAQLWWRVPHCPAARSRPRRVEQCERVHEQETVGVKGRQCMQQHRPTPQWIPRVATGPPGVREKDGAAEAVAPCASVKVK